MIKDNKDISRCIEDAYNNHKFILTYRTVYQPTYSVNAGYYAFPVYRYTHTKGGFTKRGRYFHLSGDEINELLGCKVVTNLD